MLVQCPKCHTTYKVADELLKGSTPSFRCTRCKHTFEPELSSAPETEAAPGAPAGASEVDRELRLPLEPQHRLDEASSESTGGGADTPAQDNADDRWSMSDNTLEDENRFVLSQKDPSPMPADTKPDQDFPAYDPFFPKLREDADDAGNILAISSYREEKASLLPFMTLFGLLVIAFSLLTILSHARPQAAEGVIKRIPLIGASLLKNQHLKTGIVIQSLRSGYQTIQGNREVFLVNGVAVNQNPVVVREIQLTAVTYNDDGKELERQTTWVGNTISPKIIRGMTIEDIPHLQDLKPLKSFEVPPGDSIPFTIVFLKSAKNAKTFTCEVVATAGAT
jgi:predicted Zn finger-like uncharacterized protein